VQTGFILYAVFTLFEVYQISLGPNIFTIGKSKVSGTIQVLSQTKQFQSQALPLRRLL
jgi:hypothetical protein